MLIFRTCFCGGGRFDASAIQLNCRSYFSTWFHSGALILKAFRRLADVGGHRWPGLGNDSVGSSTANILLHWKCSNYFQYRVGSILRPRSNHALFARINSQPEAPQQSTPDAAGPVGRPFPLKHALGRSEHVQAFYAEPSCPGACQS